MLGGAGGSQGVGEAAAAVAPGPDLDLLMAGLRHEPCKRSGREAAVEPASAYQHRDARGCNRRPGSGGRGGLPVKAGDPVITERHLAHQRVHIGVRLMLADSGVEQGRPVRPVHRLHRRRQRDRLRWLPGDRREPVQRAGNAVLELAFIHPPRVPAIGAAPARIEQLAIGVIRAEQRRHRDQVSIAEPGDQFGRLAFVGGAVDPDPAVRPRLRDHPADQLAVVGDLPLAEFAGARAERRPGATGVHHDQRESRTIEQIPGRRVGVRLRPGLLRRLSTVITGHPHDRADRASHRSALHRQPDIHGQPYAITYWHVHRLETTRRVNDHTPDPGTHERLRPTQVEPPL